MEIQEKTKKKIKGLKQMRSNRISEKPEYHCDNCNCDRYSECGCMKPKEKNK